MQLAFEKNAFVDAIMRQNNAMDEYLKEALIYSDVEDAQGRAWLTSMFTELENIMRDPGQSPYLKVKTLKFVVYLLLLGDIEICHFIEKKIYPYVRNLSQYDRHLRLDRRGQEIFKLHPVFVNGSAKEREQLKRLGQQYVRICMQSLPVWASWLPSDLKNQSLPSQFVKSHDALKRDGLQLPSQHDYLFYSKPSVERMEQKVRMVVEAVMKEMKQDSNFTSYITVTEQDSNSNSIGVTSELKKRRSIIRVGKSTIEPQYQKSVLELKSNFKANTQKLTVPEAFMTLTNTLANTSPHNGNGNGEKDRERDRERQHFEAVGEMRRQIDELRRQLEEKSKMQKALEANFSRDLKIQVTDAVKNAEVSNINTLRQLQAKQAETIKQIEFKYSSEINDLKKQLTIASQLPTAPQSTMPPTSSSAELSELRRQLHIVSSQRDRFLEQCNKLKKTLLTVHQDNTILLQKVKSLTTTRASLDITMNNPKLIKTAAMDSPSQSELRNQLKKLKEQNRQLRMLLLKQCRQSPQFMPKQYKRSKTQQHMIKFEDSNNYSEMFEPYYSSLTLEEQVRFRKALLKSKELLFKSNVLEVGCVTEVVAVNGLNVNLFVTNTSLETVTGFAWSVMNNPSVQMTKTKEKSPSTLLPNAQEKLSLSFAVKQADCKSTLIKLQYCVRSQCIIKYLLLPISKIKLIQPRQYTPTQSLPQLKQRTIELDTRLISSLPKLREYCRQLHQDDKTFKLQFDYLNDKYELQLTPVGKLIRIGIRSEEGGTEDIQGLLEEYAFVLSKDSS